MFDRGQFAKSEQFRPSDYSAALVQRLLDSPLAVQEAHVLDIGCGSGVLLAAAGAAGAGHLTGVDIEPDAVAATTALLNDHGFAGRHDIHQGAFYAPLGERRFDLVLANLPHFPMNPTAIDGRLPSWSAGGPDGRALLDPFLNGLPQHLAPEGHALVMHNAFIDLDRTRAFANDLELCVAELTRFFVPLPLEKLSVMTPEIVTRETGTTIHHFGQHAFGAVAVLGLTHAAAKGFCP